VFDTEPAFTSDWVTLRVASQLIVAASVRVAGIFASVPDLTTGGSDMENTSAELAATLERYLRYRAEVDGGTRPWSDLVEFFTDDAIFIDPAWGRIQGIDAIGQFLVESMTGIEDWTFPVDHLYVDGNDVIVKFRQILPDGSEQSGYSSLIYAGGGKFCYEEDVLNMTHVFEDMIASGWQLPPGMKLPPKNPDRNFSRP